MSTQKYETNIYENFLQFKYQLRVYKCETKFYNFRIMLHIRKYETAKNHSPLSFIGGKHPPVFMHVC